MPYIDFKAHLKKVNLKPKGVKEIVLEVSDSGLDGKLDDLSNMIDQKVEIQFDSLVVNYNVKLDVKTNRPITRYEVDNKGVVEVSEPEVSSEKQDVVEDEQEISRETVDQFILQGMAPDFEDLPVDFANVVKRKLEGESFSKLAAELEISSGKIVEFVDTFRSRVAPLAQAWWDWKEKEKGES